MLESCTLSWKKTFPKAQCFPANYLSTMLSAKQIVPIFAKEDTRSGLVEVIRSGSSPSAMTIPPLRLDSLLSSLLNLCFRIRKVFVTNASTPGNLHGQSFLSKHEPSKHSLLRGTKSKGANIIFPM